MKFKKKIEQVEAFQWTGDSEALNAWRDTFPQGVPLTIVISRDTDDNKTLYIIKDHKKWPIQVGTWIVVSNLSHVSWFADGPFKANYEETKETDPCHHVLKDF